MLSTAENNTPHVRSFYYSIHGLSYAKLLCQHDKGYYNYSRVLLGKEPLPSQITCKRIMNPKYIKRKDITLPYSWVRLDPRADIKDTPVYSSLPSLDNIIPNEYPIKERLTSSFKPFTILELKEMCEQNGVNSRGKVADLTQRLLKKIG